MRRLGIRIVLVFAILSTAAVVGIQVYWLGEMTRLENRLTEDRISTGLSEVSGHIIAASDEANLGPDHLRRLQRNHYVIILDVLPDSTLINALLYNAFSHAGLQEPFTWRSFDCADGSSSRGPYFDWDSTYAIKQIKTPLPPYQSDKSFISVFFPSMERPSGHRRAWILSIGVLLLVMLFFGLTLIIMLRQRRLTSLTRDFISNMTHEFRTPIASISIAGKTLQDPKVQADSTRLNRYAKLIEKEILRLQTLVEKALQVTSLEKREPRLHTEEVNLHKLLHQLADNMQWRIRETNTKLRLKLQAQQPNLVADRTHIFNVFYNLIDNAIKYSEQEPQITIETSDSDRYIKIRVADKGRGMSKGAQKMAFQKFFRDTDGDRHDIKGYGLGLSYVQMVIEAHKARIELQSEPGEGTTFTLYLRRDPFHES